MTWKSVRYRYIEVHAEDAPGSATQLSLQQQMDAAIVQSLARHQPVKTSSVEINNSVEAAIKVEMVVYESSGVRGHSLQLVYEYLQTIPPASVEAERAFSAAGIRSRLGDEDLSALCFLQSLYRNRKR